ncbi:MAG: hypothetical protein R2873_03380 [Caldilineaceae bacterium]
MDLRADPAEIPVGKVGAARQTPAAVKLSSAPAIWRWMARWTPS